MSLSSVERELVIDRKWLLEAAKLYNEGSSDCPDDSLYDLFVRKMKRDMLEYPEEWKSCTVCPEVFNEGEASWTYTSHHFPKEW